MEAVLSMKKECGTGRFRIKGWSLLQQKKGDKISSGTIIEVAGAQWALEVWPKGAECSTEGWIRLALACSATDKAFPKAGLRSTYSLAVVNPKGDDNMVKETGPKCCLFKSGEGWGWDDFMKITQLEKSYLVNDEVIFEGSVTVVVQEELSRTTCLIPTSKHRSAPIAEPDADGSLSCDMKVMLESGKNTDVVLKTSSVVASDRSSDEPSELKTVPDEELHVHSNILAARSPVFAALLNAKMRECQSGIVEIDDVDATTMRRLVEFLYTDRISGDGLWDDADAAGSLLQAAVKYDVSGLVMLCARKVAEIVTKENAADWLVLATRVGQRTDSLKQQCLQLIANNLCDVQATEGWQRLMQDALLMKEVAPLLFQAICPPPVKKLKVA
mmetsp:Transcript_29106/g.53072  ORF Transcript_29106/g.53072 Transcript_29106/m.53072 type:complete len:386 (+) Transcript_29106:134-1291(+)